MRIVRPLGWIAAVAVVLTAPAHGAPLTADGAVQVALKKNTQVVQAEASLLDSKSGLWSAYSGVLPRVSASYGRSGSYTKTPPSVSVFQILDTTITSRADETVRESYSTSPGVSGNWNLLNLSSWRGVQSARKGMEAARHSRTATRNEVVLSVRRQFYEAVKAYHLLRVSSGALRLARDNERRVRALFEVGSVSKSDLLKARVQTSQSQLDSLNADINVTAQRIALANQLGLPEAELGEVDTTLTATPHPVDAAEILREARGQRPDLRAAEADVKGAEAGVSSARFARLPYLSAGGSMDFNTRSRSKTAVKGQEPRSGFSDTDRSASGQIALNLDVFDGFAMDARAASARARLMRARETRDALVRNLESEVHQAVLGYREAVERESLARDAVASASENLNLVQQKYNVGSATILDLIDSQVQLQRAQNDLVSALAAIRVADATLERVRGRGE